MKQFILALPFGFLCSLFTPLICQPLLMFSPSLQSDWWPFCFLISTVGAGYLLASCCRFPLARGWITGLALTLLIGLGPGLGRLGLGLTGGGCGNCARSARSEQAALCLAIGAATQLLTSALRRIRSRSKSPSWVHTW